jgi:hypothetical protein
VYDCRVIVAPMVDSEAPGFCSKAPQKATDGATSGSRDLGPLLVLMTVRARQLIGLKSAEPKKDNRLAVHPA